MLSHERRQRGAVLRSTKQDPPSVHNIIFSCIDSCMPPPILALERLMPQTGPGRQEVRHVVNSPMHLQVWVGLQPKRSMKQIRVKI